MHLFSAGRPLEKLVSGGVRDLVIHPGRSLDGPVQPRPHRIAVFAPPADGLACARIICRGRSRHRRAVRQCWNSEALKIARDHGVHAGRRLAEPVGDQRPVQLRAQVRPPSLAAEAPAGGGGGGREIKAAKIVEKGEGERTPASKAPMGEAPRRGGTGPERRRRDAAAGRQRRGSGWGREKGRRARRRVCRDLPARRRRRRRRGPPAAAARPAGIVDSVIDARGAGGGDSPSEQGDTGIRPVSAPGRPISPDSPASLLTAMARRCGADQGGVPRAAVAGASGVGPPGAAAVRPPSGRGSQRRVPPAHRTSERYASYDGCRRRHGITQ